MEDKGKDKTNEEEGSQQKKHTTPYNLIFHQGRQWPNSPIKMKRSLPLKTITTN
jgi:hypothetical protein